MGRDSSNALHMANNISVPRGTTDILPTEVPLWRDIENKARRILHNYNYKEVRTPHFEDIGLFKRTLGAASDVVNKQLLGLTSDKKEGFALRPEGTASIVRSYIENSLDKKEAISKLFYIGPMFRGERPQKGRLRQFHQIGVEVIGPGAGHPYLDAEVIALNAYLLKAFGILDFHMKINTLGTPEDKDNFSKLLRNLIKPMLSKLCPDCQNRFKRNVFRVLDCKIKGCKDIVGSLKIDHSHLSDESLTYFGKATQALDSLGVKYEIDHSLVRGLDYYTHTVFEITASTLGSQDALSAGGRYDHLVRQLGGRDVPATGFALGIERVILSMPAKFKAEDEPLSVFVIAMDEPYFGKAFKVLEMLRKASISADMSYNIASMKSQMRLANKNAARAVIIIGEEEDKADKITVKCMKTGEQTQVEVNTLIDSIEEILKKSK